MNGWTTTDKSVIPPMTELLFNKMGSILWSISGKCFMGSGAAKYADKGVNARRPALEVDRNGIERYNTCSRITSGGSASFALSDKILLRVSDVAECRSEKGKTLPENASAGSFAEGISF